jgi:hypothetical protein
MCRGDFVRIPTAGTVPRADTCVRCWEPMLYHVNAAGVPDRMFCPNHRCSRWLREVAILDERLAGTHA